MLDLAHARHFARRSKKYWVAALCTASFACGNYLFGDDENDSESLFSQYQQATQQLVTEVQPSTARRPSSATSTTSHTSRLQPAKAQSASAATPGQPATSSVLVPQQSNVLAPQQKSSRRVKPSQPPTTESAVTKADLPIKDEAVPQFDPAAKAESLAKSDLPVSAEPLAADESPATGQSVDLKADLAQQRTVTAPAAAETTPATAPTENKPLPMVTYMPSPSQVTPRQLAPRMEIITPATSNLESPRTQDLAARSASPVAAKPVPMQAELWLPANPVPSQPLPQVINVSRQAAALPQPPKLAESLAELNDASLPPIVSPDQIPRPGTRKKTIQPAAQSTPILRIDLGKK